MADKWFYVHEKKKLGPFTAQELKDRVASGQLTPATMVLKEGETRWTDARSIPGLFPEAPKASPAAAPPPFPPAPALDSSNLSEAIPSPEPAPAFAPIPLDCQTPTPSRLRVLVLVVGIAAGVLSGWLGYRWMNEMGKVNAEAWEAARFLASSDVESPPDFSSLTKSEEELKKFAYGMAFKSMGEKEKKALRDDAQQILAFNRTYPFLLAGLPLGLAGGVLGFRRKPFLAAGLMLVGGLLPLIVFQRLGIVFFTMPLLLGALLSLTTWPPILAKDFAADIIATILEVLFGILPVFLVGVFSDIFDDLSSILRLIIACVIGAPGGLLGSAMAGDLTGRPGKDKHRMLLGIIIGAIISGLVVTQYPILRKFGQLKSSDTSDTGLAIVLCIGIVLLVIKLAVAVFVKRPTGEPQKPEDETVPSPVPKSRPVLIYSAVGLMVVALGYLVYLNLDLFSENIPSGPDPAPRKPPEFKPVDQGKKTTELTANKPIEYTLTAGELEKANRADSNAFYAKYAGKRVELTGLVKLVRVDPKGFSDVFLEGPPAERLTLNVVVIAPRDADRDKFEGMKALSTGQLVTVRGEVMKYGCILQECEFVKVGPSTALPMTVSSLTAAFQTPEGKEKYDEKDVVLRAEVQKVEQDGDKVAFTISEPGKKNGPVLLAWYCGLNKEIATEVAKVQQGTVAVFLGMADPRNGDRLWHVQLLANPPEGVILPGSK